MALELPKFIITTSLGTNWLEPESTDLSRGIDIGKKKEIGSTDRQLGIQR